jgi:hypothetical protein
VAIKNKLDVEAALDVLEDTIPPLLGAAGIKPDVCVGATRIACLALAEVGIKASPLPVRVQAMSARYRAALVGGEIAAVSSEEEAQRLAAEGAHMVDIGHPHNEGRIRSDGSRGYNAHLVALVERRWVLDLTIPQVNRPAKGIWFEPLHFAATREFMGGTPLVFRNDEGATLVYVRVENNTYLVAPDWTTIRRDDRLVRATAAKLRAAI